MSCTLTTGFDKGCLEGMGGVVEFYFGNYVSDISFTQDPTGKVTAISGTALTYYKYEMEQENGSATETYQSDGPAGSNYVQQDLAVVLNKMSQDKRNEIKLLTRALTSVIVKDANGKYWLYGQERGIRPAPGGTGATGTASGDRNGYNLTFIGREIEAAPEVELSAFSALIG